jgi:RHS repeat-associated protein
MSGQTVTSAQIPLPGGLTAHLSGTGGSNRNIYHTDWLGTVRLSTTLGNRTENFDAAYTPYGELYDSFGTVTEDFTGDLQDTFSGLFDTPNRELSQPQGRWLSPDPAHQGWNLYGYSTNPNSEIDPSGAWGYEVAGCGGAGSGTGSGVDCSPGEASNPNLEPPPPGMCGNGANPVDCGIVAPLSGGKVGYMTFNSGLGNLDQLALEGGFWGSRGVAGSDGAANMIGNLFLGMLGRTSWSKWWQETGCHPGKLCMAMASPAMAPEWEAPSFMDVAPKEGVDFYHPFDTAATFIRVDRFPEEFFRDYIHSKSQISRSGALLNSEYGDNLKGSGMWRNSNHYGDQTRTSWFLDNMDGAHYDRASGLYMFDQPVCGFCLYGNMYPYP